MDSYSAEQLHKGMTLAKAAGVHLSTSAPAEWFNNDKTNRMFHFVGCPSGHDIPIHFLLVQAAFHLSGMDRKAALLLINAAAKELERDPNLDDISEWF